MRAIVGLAKGLGIDIVAEGVETEESWSTLAELGCDVAQGFFICRPLPLPELVEWLEIRQMATMASVASLADVASMTPVPMVELANGLAS